MSLKHPTRDYQTKVRNELIKLDSEGKIDLSKVYNSLHFERIINYICTESKTNWFTLEELLEPETLERMIKSRHYNWIRPEVAIKYDAYTFDFKTLTKKERQKLLDFPLDELRNMISDYLQIHYKLPMLSPLQMLDLADFFVNQFIEPIIGSSELLWDPKMVNSIVSIIGERSY